MFNNPFSFEGRIRRTEYGLSLIIANTLIFIVKFFFDSAELGEWIFYLLLTPFFMFMLAQRAKRCHDLGYSGWFQIIPFSGILMLLKEGNNGINEYGINPKGSGNPETNLEKKVETYILEKANPKFYYTIEFGEKKVFNLKQLIKEYKLDVNKNIELKESQENKKTIESLKTLSKKTDISYSMTFTFGFKEIESDKWETIGAIVLLDINLNIIGHFYYSA